MNCQDRTIRLLEDKTPIITDPDVCMQFYSLHQHPGLFCVWMHPSFHIALRLKQMKGDDELKSVFDGFCAMNVTSCGELMCHDENKLWKRDNRFSFDEFASCGGAILISTVD